MSKGKPVIVKKINKHGGGGHHGGMWKVAYADFVTAMMAFFLLLWLLSMVSEEKRARISAYFKYFSLYESGGTSWMDKSSEIFGESGENKQKAFKGLNEPPLNDDSMDDSMLDNMKKELEKDIAEKLGDIKDQVMIEMTDEGIRIQMIDKEGSLMFERGNPRLTPKAKEVLQLIGKDIKALPNKVIIEGHTDSLPYAGSQYSNWELSTERASSARKELEANGLDAKRITRVAGYADTEPFVKEDTTDPRNRRISITLQNSKRKVARIKYKENKIVPITADEGISGLSNVREKPSSAERPRANEQEGEVGSVAPYEKRTPVIHSPATGGVRVPSDIDKKQIFELIDNADKVGKEDVKKAPAVREDQNTPPEKNHGQVVIKELSSPIMSPDPVFSTKNR